jgi:zinc/manganese transport system permease protein
MSETISLFSRQIILIAIVLILHTYIGLHIIRRSLIFSDLVLDQLAAFGALIGVALHIQYGSALSYLLAMAAVIFGSLLLALLKPRSREIPREVVIGILYAMALVFSLLLTDKLPGGQMYVEKTLSGYMEWVSWSLVTVTIIVYVLLLVFHYILRKKFITLAENPKKLQNEILWDFIFFTTQGIITVLIVPIAGVLLAYAFLMIPAAIAAMFTKKWIEAIIIGWSIGFIACLLGLSSSYIFGFTYGPSLVLSLGAFFILAAIIRSLRFSKGT